MAFAPIPTDETPRNQAFLSPNDEEDNFAALDSMMPRSFNNHPYSQHNQHQQHQQYGQQQGQGQPPSNALVTHAVYGQGQGQIVPHSAYNTQSSYEFHSSTGVGMGGTGGGAGETVASNIGSVSNGRDGGFSGVSESLFDRIRARTEQQKQGQGQTPLTSQPQQSQMSQQQNPSEPTMELEKDTSASSASSAANVRSNTNETTYSFSGPSDFSQSNPTSTIPTASTAPRPPTYGPSRTDGAYSSADNAHNAPASIQEKAVEALGKTSETVLSLWNKASTGAQNLVASAGVGGGGMGGARGEGGRGGYSNNFLLRDGHDEEDGAVAGSATATMGGMGGMGSAGPAGSSGTAGTATGGGGGESMTSAASMASAASAATGQAYSMASYAKTFCEDLIGFLKDLPMWGKGIVGILLLWLFFALK